MKNWYCIYTKYRYEDHISKRLGAFPDIEVLNPKLSTKRYYSKGLRHVVENLFPCYLFLKFEMIRYYRTVKYTRGVRRIVGDESGNPYIVTKNIIDQIRSRTKDGFICIDLPDFKTGDHIIVQKGPFKGFSGIFQRELKASDRVMILLNTLTYQAEINLNKAFLVAF